MIENNQEEKNKLEKNKGCGIVLLLIVFSLWVIIFSGADLFIGWTIEQSLFESSIGITDFRW